MIAPYVITLFELGTADATYDLYRLSRLDEEPVTFPLERAVAPEGWQNPGQPLLPAKVFTACSEDTVVLVVLYGQGGTEELGYTIYEATPDFSEIARRDVLPVVDWSQDSPSPYFDNYWYRVHAGSCYYANGRFYLTEGRTYTRYWYATDGLYRRRYERGITLLSGASLLAPDTVSPVYSGGLLIAQGSPPTEADVPNKKTVHYHRHGFCLDDVGGAHLITSCQGPDIVLYGNVNYPRSIYYHYSPDGGASWEAPVTLYTASAINPSSYHYLTARRGTVIVSLAHPSDIAPMGCYFSRIGSGEWEYLASEPESGATLAGAALIDVDDTMRIYHQGAFGAFFQSADWGAILPPTFTLLEMGGAPYSPPLAAMAASPSMEIQRCVGGAVRIAGPGPAQWRAVLLTNQEKKEIDQWEGTASGAPASTWLYSCCGGYHPPLAGGYSFWW